MKILPTVLLKLLIVMTATVAMADEPPCNCEFSISSDNDKYIAKVNEVNSANTESARWQLSVYKNSASDKSLLWTSKFNHNGYPQGILSDDGKVFATVNSWYYPDTAIVNIYRQGKVISELKGRDFAVNENKLVRTVSHYLWLNDKKWHTLESTDDSCTLTINAIDSKARKIDCISGELTQ